MMAQAENFDAGQRHNHFDFHSNYTYGRVEILYALHQNMSTTPKFVAPIFGHLSEAPEPCNLGGIQDY